MHSTTMLLDATKLNSDVAQNAKLTNNHKHKEFSLVNPPPDIFLTAVRQAVTM